MKRSLIAMAVIGAASVGIISAFLYTTVGSGDLTDRTVNNPVQSGDTKAVENPAPPEQPAFPLPNQTGPSSILAFNSTAPGAR